MHLTIPRTAHVHVHASILSLTAFCILASAPCTGRAQAEPPRPDTKARPADEGNGRAVVDIGGRRELFVDDTLIDQIEGDVRRVMHTPTPRESVLVHNAPWEGSGSGYHTVIQDGDTYRLYYRGSHLEVTQGKLRTGGRPQVYCYAESRDGVHWTKPKLGLVEFQGSRDNNIFLSGRGTHNFAPFKDTNPMATSDAKFKAFGGVMSEGGLFAFQSADGVHWKLLHPEPVITKGAFDSQNTAFWDGAIKKYRAYYRVFTSGETTKSKWAPSGRRAIRTAVSDDFIHWTDHRDLAYEDSPPVQLYTNQISPYARAPHLLIGIPTRYIDRGWSPSMRALPQLANRELRASANRRYGTALTEAMLMSSRDGVQFERWNEAFMRPGIGRDGTWQYGQHYVANNVVITQSDLPGAPPELSLYATEDHWHGDGGALRRYTMRLDGFVSLHGSWKGGHVTTRPLRWNGEQLTLNASTSAAGSIHVELIAEDGKPLPGFEKQQCEELFGDAHDLAVQWKDADLTLKKLAGRSLQIRFHLQDADLYSFQFRHAAP